MLHDEKCEAELIDHHVGHYSGCDCADRMEARMTARVAALTAERDAALERERYWLRHKQHETGLRITAEARVAKLAAALREIRNWTGVSAHQIAVIDAALDAAGGA